MDIYQHISNLFKDKLKEVRFEIMVPIGGRLTKPNLPPNQELEGKSLKAIFQQKVIYVRPFQNISNQCEIEQLEVDLCGNEPSNNDYDDLQFQFDTERAMLCSAVETNIKTSDLQEKTLEDILQSYKSAICEEKTTQINVFREEIFDCCVRALQRKSFSPFNKLSVKFSDIEGKSEGAVDVGGPTREMCRLVINHIKDSRLFFGDNEKYITLNGRALEKRDYFEAGRIISLTIIHGGCGPKFFSEHLYAMIVSDLVNTKPTVLAVEDDIRNKIMLLNEINDFESFHKYVYDESIFGIAGCQIVTNISEKDKVIKGNNKSFYCFPMYLLTCF